MASFIVIVHDFFIGTQYSPTIDVVMNVGITHKNEAFYKIVLMLMEVSLKKLYV